MKFAIIVHHGCESPNAQTALDFCRNLPSAGHTIARIFFLSDGVMLASAEAEHPVQRAWHHFLATTGTDAVCCIGSAVKRGLADASDPRVRDKIADAFAVSGLGQYAEACALADRVVDFH